MSRSRSVRLIARLLIFTLYLNGIGPILIPPADPVVHAATASPTDGGGSSSGANVSLFGPKRYTRTGGLFNLFSDSISVPDWMRPPYVVRIKNGESDGSHRVTGALILLNGLPVATPLDFNHNTNTVDRPVLLLPLLLSLLGMTVQLYGPSGSYVTITVMGTSGDTRAPVLTITEPAANTTTSDNTPHLALTYSDSGTSNCNASGIDTSSLHVTLDGVDRTSLFTATSSGAQATIPDNLALSDGTHALHAEIRDRAGNLTTADRTFSVRTVTEPPTLTITAPAEGALVNSATLAVSGTVVSHGNGAIGVQCRVGEDAAPASITGSTWSCTVPLTEGDNAILVSATDAGGTSQATRQVVRDSTAPALSIASPTDGAYTAESSVAVSGSVSDVHDVTVTVNGIAAGVSGNQFQVASVPVGSGPTNVIQATATDTAGNQSSTQITLNVRQNPLTVQITSPANGAVVRGPLVDVQGTTNHDLPVNVDVNGVQATVGSDGSFTAPQVPVLEGTQTLHATAHDAAGRTATADATVRVDTIAPTVTIDQPATGLVTNATTVHIAGNVSDTSPITLTVNDQNVPIANGQFATDFPLGAVDGSKTLTIVATDSVGNATTSTVTVIVDRAAPTLDVAAPATGALVSALPIVVQGTVTDQNAVTVTVDGTAATRTADAWQVSFPTLPDGPHTFAVAATDAAGNVTTKTVPVTLDTAAPVLTITAPPTGTLTRLNTIDVAGTVQDTSAATVIAAPGNLSASVSHGTFTITGVPLATDGDTTIVVSATDATNRTSQASVVVTRDSTAPQLALNTPDRITRRQSAQAVAAATDASGVAQVVFAVNGAAAGTLTASPFAIPLTVPDGLAIGATFVVSATATDRAGNVSTATRNIRIAADGAVVGQVLSDATGRPIEHATVHIGADTRTTDTLGRYTLPTDQTSIALSVDQDGMTSVSRVVSMATGTGTVPVDARLTALAAPVSIGAAGGQLAALSTVGSGPTAAAASGTPAPVTTPTATDPIITIAVPAGAIAAGTSDMRLTPLSAQGLPDLLPLGWSPIAGFDLRSAMPVAGPLNLRATFAATQASALGSSTLALVEYRPLLHAWVVIARDLAPDTGGAIATTVPGTGAFALAMPDTQDPPIVVPAVGDPLSGVAAMDIPATATSQGNVEPAVIPPTGGSARGQLRVDSPAPLPSGTLVQAEITETFTLPSNQVASEEQRREDIVLYRAPGRAIASAGGTTTPDVVPPVSGTLPIVPSRTFDPGSLLEGRVHLDILAGRESVRGTPGGREAVTVTADDARLVVPAGALDDDTAIALTSAAFSSFLPTHAALTPLAELLIDLPGATLRSAAELSIAATAAAQAPGGSFVIARVDRVDGVPFLTVVSLAELSGDRVIARPAPGLPGITSSGRYLFYRVAGAIGFVSGVTRAGGQPATSVLSTDSLPFITRSDASGGYTIGALAGGAGVTVTARVPRTSLITSGTVPVTAGGVATLDLILAATVTTATVSPADGERGVSRQPQVTVTTSTPIARDSLTTDAVHLFKVVDTTTTAVSVRALLAGSGQTLSIVPDARLDADTLYRLEVAGLTDAYGGAVSVPISTFRTAVEAAPTYSPDALTFSFPDSAGVVTIAAPANSFPLGAQFLIINSVSGEVVSLSAGNDGSVSGRIGATLNDRLVITITDADGRVTTLTRSQFVDPATGRTAIGPGGGTVEGPGGVALRIPEGAMSQAVTFKITPVGEDQFPTQPDVPGAHFGSGLKIEASATTRFAKEAHLVFPVPQDAAAAAQAAGMQAKDAFYYVFSRGTASDGQPVFETLDYANVEGTGDDAKVVTASFPFIGFVDVGGLAAGYVFVMWTFNQLLPGQPTNGVITGQVLRPVFQNGSLDPVYVGVPGARVELVDPSDNRFDPHTGAITQADGRYTIFDHRFISEPIHIKATVDGETATATVFAVQRTDTKTLADPGLATLISRGFFKQIATANLTLAPAQPAPPSPALTIRTMRAADGHRIDTRGLVVAGTQLIVGVDADGADVLNVSIAPVGADERDEVSHAVQVDPALSQSPRDPLAMPFVTDTFTLSPGSYRIKATAIPAFGPVVSATTTVRVLASGGGVSTDNTLRPAVITAQTVPRANAAGVPVSVAPQLAFTEPVLHIPGNVRLRDATGADVPIKIGGVNIDASGQPIVIDDVTDAATVVTGLTIQPRFGLAYGTTYHLELTEDIIDLDVAADGTTPASKNLVAFATTFTTFGPSPIGGTETQFTSPGLVVLGDRAYALETKFAGGVGGIQTGALRVFDVSDPVSPQELSSTPIDAAPRDIAGEDHTVAVVTMPHTQFLNGDILSGPSNLLVYDVTGQTPQWIGAASLTDNIVDGTPNRIVIKEGMAYVATLRKGLQVVDLSQAALGDLASVPAWEQYRRLYAPGEGVNRQAVVVTMPITDPATPGNTASAWLYDLKVGDYRVDDVNQRLVLGTGVPAALGLVIVNPVTQTIVAQSAVQDGSGSIAGGQAIALTRIGDRDLAIVGGYGTVGGAGASGVVAIVDLSPLAATPHGTPRPIAWVALTHGVGDILIVGNTAVVSAPSSNALTDTGMATLINLADPFHPLNAGTLTGVGSRLAETGGILLSTNKTLLSGTQSPLGGVRTSALGEAALITRVDPEPIVVSAGDEVFTNVVLSYRALPWDPTMTAGEVQINVRNGGRVATLPALINNATGSVTWPKGSIVNTLQTYEATLHVTQDGREIRPLPRRLRFDKLPLALTTRDRLLRIQFALPTQGQFSQENHKYGVKVYMTQPGTAMPTDPVFTLNSEQIKNAYPNEDQWWPGDPASAAATADWVTRKIDKMELPPGTNTEIHRQAFEIGTMLAGYPEVKVAVIDEEDGGRELRIVQGVVTQDGEWATMLTRIEARVQQAAGVPVADDPAPPPPTYEPNKKYSLLSALIYRAAHRLIDQAAEMGVQFVHGVIDGFVDGLVGDKDTVVQIGQAIIHPIKTAQAIWGFVKEAASFMSISKATATLQSLVRSAGGITLPPLDIGVLLQRAAYFGGYLIGYLVEQVLVAVLIGVVTAGIGAAVALAAEFIGEGVWIVKVAGKILTFLRTVAYWFEALAEMAADSRIARASIALLKDASTFVEALWAKYPQATTIIKRLAQTSVRVSSEVAQTAMKWLTIVDRMVDAAAERVIGFVEKKGSALAERMLTRWTDVNQLRNGKRAVKDAFEAYDRADQLADGPIDALIVAADRTFDSAQIEINGVKGFTDKYRATIGGDRVESSLTALRHDLTDTRFSDDAIGETVKFHGQPDVPAMKNEAVEGTARLESIPCVRFAGVPAMLMVVAMSVAVPTGCGKDVPELVRANYPDMLDRYEAAATNLKALADPQTDEAVARVMWTAHHTDPDTAKAAIRATGLPGATPEAVAEYMKAVDAMRDENARIITGILDQATPGSSINIRRVGNQGGGSLAEGYEIVAMQRMVEGRSAKVGRVVSRSEIASFGPKFDVSEITHGARSTIEADCFLKDRTLIDMKHSLTGDPSIDDDLLDVLETVLKSPARPIDRVWYIPNVPITSPSTLQKIQDINNRLGGALIRIIDDLGDFR